MRGPQKKCYIFLKFHIYGSPVSRPMNKFPENQKFLCNIHCNFFLNFDIFLTQIGQFSSLPICHKDTKYFEMKLFLGLKKKCFAENHISLSHLLRNIFYCGPLISMYTHSLLRVFLMHPVYRLL